MSVADLEKEVAKLKQQLSEAQTENRILKLICEDNKTEVTLSTEELIYKHNKELEAADDKYDELLTMYNKLEMELKTYKQKK